MCWFLPSVLGVTPFFSRALRRSAQAPSPLLVYCVSSFFPSSIFGPHQISPLAPHRFCLTTMTSTLGQSCPGGCEFIPCRVLFLRNPFPFVVVEFLRTEPTRNLKMYDYATGEQSFFPTREGIVVTSATFVFSLFFSFLFFVRSLFTCQDSPRMFDLLFERLARYKINFPPVLMPERPTELLPPPPLRRLFPSVQIFISFPWQNIPQRPTPRPRRYSPEWASSHGLPYIPFPRLSQESLSDHDLLCPLAQARDSLFLSISPFSEFFPIWETAFIQGPPFPI